MDALETIISIQCSLRSLKESRCGVPNVLSGVLIGLLFSSAAACTLLTSPSEQDVDTPTARTTPLSGLFSVIVHQATLLSGPDSGSELIALLSEGEIVVVSGISSSREWLRVQMVGPRGENVEGWMPAGHLSEIDLLQLTPDEVSEGTVPTPTITSIPQTETPTLSIADPTEELPIATAILDANCRRGPAIVYGVVGFLLEDQQALLRGRNPDGGWWWIVLPSNGVQCWISSSTVSTTGDTAALPVLTPPPPPQTSPTPSATESQPEPPPPPPPPPPPTPVPPTPTDTPEPYPYP